MTATSAQTNQLDQLIDELMVAASFDMLPEKEAAAMREQLLLMAEERLGFVVMNALSPEDRAAYEEQFGDGSDPEQAAALQDEAAAFISERVPDLPQRIEATMKQFAEDVIASIEMTRESSNEAKV